MGNVPTFSRGGDLATVSSGPDSAGVNAQDGESELMDADGCAMVSETLRDQVERFVIRFECGDFEPLAGIVINPPAETEDIDREIKIDSHLAGLGVRLSKRDALARYGRTEAAGDEDALKAPETPLQGGFGGPAAGLNSKTALQTHDKALQNARKEPDGEGEGSGLPPSQIAKNRPSRQSAESGPLRPTSRPSGAEAVLAEVAATILDGSVPYEEALKAAQEKLSAIDPGEIGGDLEKALEDAMFKAAASAAGKGGRFVAKGEGGKISPKDKADKPGASGDSGSSGASGEAADEITQEEAERLYEEIMSK